MVEINIGSEEWLRQVKENIVEPEMPIIDPHHHLWPGESQYLLEDLWDDTSSGHNIKHTVFIECTQEFLTSGPEHLKPVGETIFVKKKCRMWIKSQNTKL